MQNFYETVGGRRFIGVAEAALNKYLHATTEAITVPVRSVEETINKNNGLLVHAFPIDDGEWYTLVFKK